MFGLAEVAQGGDVFVGVAEVERDHGFLAAGADPLEQLHGFEVVVHAAGLVLFPLEVAELLDGDREVADVAALAVVELLRGRGEEAGGLLAAPG